MGCVKTTLLVPRTLPPRTTGGSPSLSDPLLVERDNRGVPGAVDQPPEADHAPVTLMSLAQ